MGESEPGEQIDAGKAALYAWACVSERQCRARVHVREFLNVNLRLYGVFTRGFGFCDSLLFGVSAIMGA